MRPTVSHLNARNSKCNRTLRAAIDALEPRRFLAGDLSLSCPSSITVPAGKTIQVPVTVDGGATISFDADPSSYLNAGFRADTNPWLELVTSRGTMRFQLFADLAPNTVRAIRGLVDSGFYDGLSFDRVVDSNGFQLIQGGSPDHTLAGGFGATFDDEFNPDAIYDGSGQLGMASGGKDLNGTQFFVTGAAARSLDFNYTVFGQLVRGADVLQSIVATADPNADTSVGKPLATTTIESARIVSDAQDAVMQIRASTKTGTRTVFVTATDDDGNSVSQTVKVRVVADPNYTPPILSLDPKYTQLSAVAGSVLTIPFDVIDLENQQFRAGLNVESDSDPGVDSAGSTIDEANKLIHVAIKPGFVGTIRLKFGVKEYNAVNRGLLVLSPGEDIRSLSIFDTQEITISVGGTPIEKTMPAGALSARVGSEDSLKDAVLATFASDDDADDKDFSATINWGDGTGLDAARIEKTGDGSFAVVAHDGHAYARAADGLPVTISISGANGTGTTVRTTAVVGDPATLTSDGTLTVRGTAGDDIVRLETDDESGELIVRVGDERLSFTRSNVARIVVDLYAGNDQFLTVDAADLPPITLNGGDGDDTLYGGDAGDLINGDAGNDQLYGNSGDDYVYGGDGDDSILGGAGKNHLYGDAGEDRIVGGGGRDFIGGGEDADKLYGRSGDDTIEGNAGVDRLYGEDGNDRLIGGSSNDRIYGGDGDDTLWGNQGNDTLNGNAGTNYRGDHDDGDTLVDLIDL